MAASKLEQVQQGRDDQTSAISPPDKALWQEPKLSFVEPRLTKHGKMEEMTLANGFFGAFSP